MKRSNEWPRVLEVDYSAARAQAIRWLGDRYLLAKPINGNHCAAFTFTVPPLALQSMATGAQQSGVARAS